MMTLAIFIFGCNASAEEVNGWKIIPTSFSFEISHNQSGVEIILISHSESSVSGDGFLIKYNQKYYFLPEGRRLFLENGKYYDIVISRIFKTDRWMVIGDRFEYLKINLGIQDYSHILPLDSVQGEIMYMAEPVFSASIGEHSFKINSPTVQGGAPPNHHDVAEVVASGGYHEAIPPLKGYFESGEISIDANLLEGYDYLSARFGIIDNQNGRIISSRISSFKFQ